MSIKELVIKVIKPYICKECLVYEKLFSINFETIDYPEINCFYSNDLNKFISIKNYERGHIVNLFSDLIKDRKEQKKINIKDVSSIMCSKSKSAGYDFENLYLFGKNVYVDRNDKWDFEECLSHFMYKKDVLDMSYYMWNGRYVWINSDGSHHFAVAVFHAENANTNHMINANVTIKYIDESVANEILNNYSIFVISSKNENYLRECLGENEIHFFDINDSTNILAVFDKSNHNISAYVKIFEQIDEKKILDFNKYLQNKLDYQISKNMNNV